jgi:excisionase family DNA binding protein
MSTQGNMRYLSVEEAAAALRVAPQTVYRWCRAGRLGAVKVGKAWRIPADRLYEPTYPVGLAPLEALMSSLAGASEHLLGIAFDHAGLAQMEAAFFDAATNAGGRLLFGRWTGDPAEIRQRLRPVLGARSAARSGLKVADFVAAYQQGGREEAVKALTAEAAEARRTSDHSYAYGTPHEYFGYHHDRMTAYEAEIGQLEGLCLLCGYRLAQLSADASGFSALLELMATHSGTIFYDGRQALLLRLPSQRIGTTP